MSSTTSSTDCSPSSSPVASNAPKFGTLVPNRIFVGGIAANTTEVELGTLFSTYGKVKGSKIISDRAGVSKGYGFVTFETEEEATRIQKEAGNIFLKDRKLNIAPAIKKQPITRVYADPLQPTQNGSVLYHNGIPYTYHNGVAFFTNPHESVYQIPQPQAAYPVVYPQTAIYIPQQQQYYHQATPNPSMPTQYVYAVLPAAPSSPMTASSQSSSSGPSTSHQAQTSQAQAGRTEYYTVSMGAGTLMSPQSGYAYQPTEPLINHTPSSIEYSDMEPISGSEGTGYRNCSYGGGAYGGSYSSPSKATYAQGACTGAGHQSPKFFGPSTSNGGGDILKTRTYKRIHGAQPHLVPKSINGVTVMAYPGPLVVKEDHHPMTPPTTPMTPVLTSALTSMTPDESIMKLQGLKL